MNWIGPVVPTSKNLQIYGLSLTFLYSFCTIDLKSFDPSSEGLYFSSSMQKTRSETFQLTKLAKNMLLGPSGLMNPPNQLR